MIQLVVLSKGRRLHYRTEFQGLPISIENRKGSIRRGEDPDGRPWQTKLYWPYGYIRGTIGTDGDHLDCFIGPDKDAPYAWIIDCLEPKTGQFDEQKIMLGFLDRDHARDAFLAHYNDQRFLGPMAAIGVEELRTLAEQRLIDGKPLVKAIRLAMRVSGLAVIAVEDFGTHALVKARGKDLPGQIDMFGGTVHVDPHLRVSAEGHPTYVHAYVRHEPEHTATAVTQSPPPTPETPAEPAAAAEPALPEKKPKKRGNASAVAAKSAKELPGKEFEATVDDIFKRGTHEKGSRGGWTTGPNGEYVDNQQPMPAGAKLATWSVQGDRMSNLSTPTVTLYEGDLLGVYRPNYDDSPSVAWLHDPALAAKIRPYVHTYREPEHVVTPPSQSVQDQPEPPPAPRAEPEPAAKKSPSKRVPRVLITGNTFPVKDQIKELGGKWDPEAKGWRVPGEHAETARKLVSGAPRFVVRQGGVASTAPSKSYRPNKCRACGVVQTFNSRGYPNVRIYRSGECQDCFEERKMGY